MHDAASKNFGLLIAYVLPGFVALWGLSGVVPAVRDWLAPSPTIPAGLQSLTFVLLASVTAGMTVSAGRWAVIDTLHHATGLPRPDWDDARLPTRLQAFDAVVEWHYRHYQFYSGMAIAFPLAFAARLTVEPRPDEWFVAGFLLLEILFVANSRNTLQRYYARTARLLGSLPRAERSAIMANGSHPPKPAPPTKPATETKKPSSGK